MPAPTGRGNSMQQIQHTAITDNPVFRVKIRSLATNYEQPADGPKKKDDQDDATKKFKMGEVVTGKEKKSDKVFTGKIVRLDRNSATVFIMDEETEKKIALDANSCKKEEEETANGDSALPFTSESKILNFFEYTDKKSSN